MDPTDRSAATDLGKRLGKSLGRFVRSKLTNPADLDPPAPPLQQPHHPAQQHPFQHAPPPPYSHQQPPAPHHHYHHQPGPNPPPLGLQSAYNVPPPPTPPHNPHTSWTPAYSPQPSASSSSFAAPAPPPPAYTQYEPPPTYAQYAPPPAYAQYGPPPSYPLQGAALPAHHSGPPAHAQHPAPPGAAAAASNHSSLPAPSPPSGVPASHAASVNTMPAPGNAPWANGGSVPAPPPSHSAHSLSHLSSAASTSTISETGAQHTYGQDYLQTHSQPETSGLPTASAPPGYPQVHPVPVPPPVRPSTGGLNGVPLVPQLAGQFNGMHLATNPQQHPVPATSPPANSRPPVFKGWDRIFDQELILQVNTRPHSARATLGDTAVLEAKKGLSRILRPGVESDLELFGQQLRMSDASACEPDFRRMNDKVVCFAISYVQCDCAKGRFKFTAEAWMNFKAACEEIAACGVVEMRVWLDQCLWLRDASQGAWAHTGLMPYVLWPVISLGVKAAGGERTVETYNRMWPFVEELAGLWSMGVIITSEYRGKTAESGIRRWLSFQLRHRCEPEEGMGLLLLNIFHGAVDSLETGWKEDVEELKDMARWNVLCDTEGSVIIGSDWKSRIAALAPEGEGVLMKSALPGESEDWDEEDDVFYKYLDGSRRLFNTKRWNGVVEWLSGNAGVDLEEIDEEQASELYGSNDLTKVNVITDSGEFQVLGLSRRGWFIWLLVAMDGRTSRFSRGHVLWTKVMHGALTCKLEDAVQHRKTYVMEQVLQEQIGTRIRISSMKCTDQRIQWT